MSRTSEQFTWLQSGRLADLPADVAWNYVVGALAIAAVLVLISYWRTLAPLTGGRRVVLCGLRLALLGGLLLVIAAPTAIMRVYDRPVRTKRPLAVLIDRSESMTTPDNRQKRRLDDALQQWDRLEPAAAQAFSAIATFAFAGGIVPVPNATAPASLPVGETRLLRSMREVLAQAPEGGWGAVVVLTDGIDTTADEAEAVRGEILTAALGAGTPLHFVIGRNRALEGEFLKLREFNVPPRAEPNTVLQLNAVFESSRLRATRVPVELRENDRTQAAGTLRLEAGRHVEAWTGEGRVTQPGVIRFELRAGETVARAEVQVAPTPPRRILLLEGKLDWTLRFLGRAVRRDGTFEFVPVWPFADAGLAVPAGFLTEFPADRELEAFGLVVLDNVRPEQLPPPRQTALTGWVKEGGILIVITSDARAAGWLGGTEIEKALPVLFAPGGKPSPEWKSPPMAPGAIPTLPRPVPPALVPLAWEDPARFRAVFGDVVPVPQFHAWAPIARLKPGAEALARHSTERSPDGSEAVVLAMQRYGRGKSVVLATDPLWRWQLSPSSEDAVAERFWITLLAWLNRDREQGFHFERPPVTTPLEQACSLRVVGAKGRSLKVTATMGSRRVSLQETAGMDEARVFQWTPPAAGFWEIEARDEERHARMWVTVEPPAPKGGELPAAAPNEPLLRVLASESGGSLLTEAPSSWRHTHLPAQLVRETRTARWHQPWLLACLVALYCVELVVRRRWQLL